MTFSTICGIILAILFGFACLILVFISLWWSTVTPYCTYHLNKRSNKIEWKCEETWDSMQKFKNKESNTHVCNLYFRVMPSELNTFVRINGDNDWVCAFEKLTFETKEDFVRFVFLIALCNCKILKKKIIEFLLYSLCI